MENSDPQSHTQNPSSSSSSSSSFSDRYLVGFLIANIVGIQHHSGTINGRQMVGLVRDPLNRFDENAIKVMNMSNSQVGFIERSLAAVLSPLLDSNLISVKGIVPNTRASKPKFKIPFQIHIFSFYDSFPCVKSAITEGGFQLISCSDASFTLSEAEAVKEKRSRKSFKNVDEIFKLVDKSLTKKGAFEPLEPPKKVIKTELFAHQKEALAWLLYRENSGELPPFWEEKNGSYLNVLTNNSTEYRPEPLRGGIFADDMGLGKTLTLLSLIAFDRYGNSPISTSVGSVDIDREEEMAVCDDGQSISVGKKRKMGKDGERKKELRSREKKQKTENFEGTKTTLVVCPPSVFSTWVSQLGEHTFPGKLKMYMFYGERTNDPEELKKYDIVITTYGTLVAEKCRLDSPMKKMEWWRVILDEAHVIKNENAHQSHAVTNLKSSRRWAVSGTPIQNGSLDLFSLMAFLRFEPFSEKSCWRKLVQDPLARGDMKGLSRLQALMATISLRRAKEDGVIGLPPKNVEIFHVELSKEERELYDHMEAQAKSVLLDYVNVGSLLHSYSTVLSIILRLRQICTDRALCPSDLNSLLPYTTIEDVSNNPELLKKMVEVLQDSEDLDCPICISPPTDVVITRCTHIFCRGCILKTLQQTQQLCPLCRRPLSQSDLFSSPPKPFDADDIGINSTSSKVSALLKLLVASRAESPTSKSVVFSQFNKMLILIEKLLKEAGFKTLRLDGSMSAKRRAAIIAEFGDTREVEPTVLLASLRASGVGINLTAASRVYLLEPWWNWAVEEQAIGRVHRIGQKENVKVVRLIAKNSIEDRMLELQERRKQLEEGSGVGGRDRKQISIDDLRTLMSL